MGDILCKSIAAPSACLTGSGIAALIGATKVALVLSGAGVILVVREATWYTGTTMEMFKSTKK